jgi:hypothetical protein
VTEETTRRITRLLEILVTECHHLDPVQINGLLCDLVKESEAGEQERVLSLLERTRYRLHTNKGKGWRSELEELENEIRIGTVVLFR